MPRMRVDDFTRGKQEGLSWIKGTLSRLEESKKELESSPNNHRYWQGMLEGLNVSIQCLKSLKKTNDQEL